MSLSKTKCWTVCDTDRVQQQQTTMQCGVSQQTKLKLVLL